MEFEAWCSLIIIVLTLANALFVGVSIYRG